MMKFLGAYSHWILLVLVFASLVGSFFSGQYDAASMIFGVIGLLAVAYLVYRMEMERKKKKLQDK
ncbi:hypothetical protein DHX103_12185 [Planococcus sp. X10-3]|uniref:hypothetical protein n=1 Tax=Planococcus sp. X10-3 TaxID=3061240 RepID=UPI003BAF655E